MDEMARDMLTTKEACDILQVSVIAMARWRKSGKIPYTKFPGNVCRYKRDDVERILKEGLK